MAVTRSNRINFAASAILHQHLKNRPPVFLQRTLGYMAKRKRNKKRVFPWNRPVARPSQVRIYLCSWTPLDSTSLLEASMVTRTECEVVVAIGKSTIDRQLVSCSIYGDFDGSVRLDAKEQYLSINTSTTTTDSFTFAIAFTPAQGSVWRAPKDMDLHAAAEFQMAKYVGVMDLTDSIGNFIRGRRRILMWNTRCHEGAPRRSECHLDVEIEPVTVPLQEPEPTTWSTDEGERLEDSWSGNSYRKKMFYHLDHGGPDWEIIVTDPYVCIWCKTAACMSIQALEKHLTLTHGHVHYVIDTRDRNKLKAAADIYVSPNPVHTDSDALVPLPDNVNLLCDYASVMSHIPQSFVWIKSAAQRVPKLLPVQPPQAVTRASRIKFNNTERLVHAASMELISDVSLEDDSADEVDEEWLWRRNETDLAKRNDISQQTKVVMKLWNRFMGEKKVASRYLVPIVLTEFTKRHATLIQQKGLRQTFSLHLANLFHSKFIEKEVIIHCLSIIDGAK